MKFRVKKLYIENFKGLKGGHTIEFGQKATFLFGPNGYGKTTVFDALELLLTGRIARVENENNEHGGKRHDSSVLHHNKDLSVVLKLLIESNGTEYVIVRQFPKSTEKLGYDKFWKDLETYMISDFDTPIGAMRETIEQAELEKAIFGDNNEEYLSQYFRLLTYIPQSESVYFLKMSQSERHSELSPLLDMSEQSDLLEDIRGYRGKLSALKKYLEDRLEEYDEIPANTPKETVAYARLTNTEELAIYDEPRPYEKLSISLAKEKRARISEELQEIKQFLDSFNPKQYSKHKINTRLNDIFKNKGFVHYVIFKELIEGDLAEVERNYDLSLAVRANNFGYKFILKNHLSSERYRSLEQTRLSYLKYRSVIYDNAGEKRNTKSMLTILADGSNGFNADAQSKASQYLEEYLLLEKNVNNSQQLLKQLQEYREHIVAHISRLSATVDAKSCPLCGYDWTSQGSLLESIQLKTDSLQVLIGNEAKHLINKEKTIKKEFLDDLVDRGAKYLDKNQPIYNFFSLVRQYGPLTDEDTRNFDALIKLVPGTKDFVIALDDLSADLSSKAQKLSDVITTNVGMYDKRIITALRSVGAYNFTNDLEFIKESGVKLSRSDVNLRMLHRLTADDLAEREEKYRKEAQSFISKNEVDSNAVIKSYLYVDLFAEKEELFDKAKSHIAAKTKYLEQQFALESMASRKKYEGQYSAVSLLFEKILSLSRDFDKSLKKYQFSLTQPLKAPFYVYSAKILQNNPNGQGIFIKTESDSSSIVFCANANTSHDALHQLSSGQLAVVSMAFHLAMNAVYTNKSLNLLIVDDPIQDMDSLNVHSFSELLRREFMDDYQVIMSTHDDLDMQYLKYMFGKALSSEDIKAWNVQELFYKVA